MDLQHTFHYQELASINVRGIHSIHYITKNIHYQELAPMRVRGIHKQDKNFNSLQWLPILLSNEMDVVKPP